MSTENVGNRPPLNQAQHVESTNKEPEKAGKFSAMKFGATDVVRAMKAYASGTKEPNSVIDGSKEIPNRPTAKKTDRFAQILKHEGQNCINKDNPQNNSVKNKRAEPREWVDKLVNDDISPAMQRKLDREKAKFQERSGDVAKAEQQKNTSKSVSEELNELEAWLNEPPKDKVQITKELADLEKSINSPVNSIPMQSLKTNIQGDLERAKINLSKIEEKIKETTSKLSTEKDPKRINLFKNHLKVLSNNKLIAQQTVTTLNEALKKLK